MANWQRTLVLKDVWPKFREDELSVQEVAKVVSERLAELKPFNVKHIDKQKEELVDEFEALSEDEDADTNNFDDVLERLYDWADTPLDGNVLSGKKVCWVATF